MSIYRYSGLVKKSSGQFISILNQLKSVDLRPVQRIDYKFDPFHHGARHIRDICFFFSTPKIRDTNFKCIFKTNIVSDLSDPEIQCKLDNGKVLLFKAGNLTVLEILQEFNRVVLPLVPPPEETQAAPKTKTQKKK